MAELESFHFDRSSSGMEYLDRIIELSFNTPILPKALYAKSFILEQEGNDTVTKRKMNIPKIIIIL